MCGGVRDVAVRDAGVCDVRVRGRGAGVRDVAVRDVGVRDVRSSRCGC